MKGDRATALVCKDDKVLMIHRLRDGNDYYVLPGGHVEDNEPVEVAVMRELKEETSIEVKLGKKLCSFLDRDGRTHHIYICDYISGTPRLAKGVMELDRTSKNNTYTPVWFDINKIQDISVWPEEEREILLAYFKRG